MEDLTEAYITKAPVEVQGVLRPVRQLVLEVDLQLTQPLSYQMPTFKKQGKAVFHCAAQKKHLVIYPTQAAIEHFGARFEGYRTSKCAFQIPYSMPLIEELIEDLARFNLDALENR
jgi:uncharacterized protein YdhG (YjbR/CyaY superfamily)